MVSASRIQTLLTCAKAQEMCLILPDGFSVGYIQLARDYIQLYSEVDLVKNAFSALRLESSSPVQSSDYRRPSYSFKFTLV